MAGAPLPPNERERLEALRRYAILDTADEASFDRITQIAARLFDVPMALVSLVDSERQWFKSCIGVDMRETSRDIAFCAYALFTPEPMVVPNAPEDPRFAKNPLVTGPPGIRFYAGAPLLTSDGFALGTLCVIDVKPRQPTKAQLDSLRDLAAVVVEMLEHRIDARSRLMFEKVSELSPDMIYVFDPKLGRNVYANREVEAVLGYDPRDAGQGLLQRMMHPDDLPKMREHFRALKSLKDDDKREQVTRIRDASGRWRWMLSREAIFERDEAGAVRAVIGIATDITDLKEAEDTLRMSEEAQRERARILQGVFDGAGEGIAVADETGRFTVFNAAAQRLLGSMPDRPGRHQAHYGIFTSDGSKVFDPMELPMVRALAGETSDDVEMLVRNENYPDGVSLKVTGRPLLDERKVVRGGVVTFSDITQLKKAQEKLASLAVTDELTGLPNVRALRERLATLVAEAGRGRKFALVLGDVDFFKKVNDTHGHQVGDQVLQAVAKALKSNVRKTDLAARYGGEEFCVLLTDVDESLAVTLADKLRLAVSAISEPLEVTCSFGVSGNVKNGMALDGETLLRLADEALYRAKREGRNRVIAATLS